MLLIVTRGCICLNTRACTHTNTHKHTCSNSFSFLSSHICLIKRILGPSRAGVLPLVAWCWSNINNNLHLLIDLSSGSPSTKAFKDTPLVQLRI